MNNDDEYNPPRRNQSKGDCLCAITDVGRVRDHNEDTFYLSEGGSLLIVADGMGGHACGEVASALAAETVAAYFAGADREAIGQDRQQIKSLLTGAFEKAHQTVVESARNKRECEGMGTTLIAAYLSGGKLYTCHVGDVRAYVHTGNGLEQITQDHSVVGQLVSAGHLTPEQARHNPARNEILQAIGLPMGIFPDFNERMLTKGDRVLLCSDGLWDSLRDEQIEAIIKYEGSVDECVKSLIDQANDAGGADNITVVLYKAGARPNPP